MKTLLSFFLVFFIIFTSCSKDDNPCSGKMSGAQMPVFDCLSKFMFDTGSVWLYQDTISSAQDQVSVTSWDTITFSGGQCGGYSAYLNIRYSSWIHGNYTEEYHLDDIRGEDSGYPLYFCTAPDILDSLVVSGTTYYQVTEITDIDYPYITPNTQLYWADSIGIIRKVYYNGPSNITTYDLQSYQVNILAYPF